MLRSLYTAATGMEAQQLKMDTIANNLANASTTGFKKVRADFEDVLSETLKSGGQTDGRDAISPTSLQVGLGVKTGSTTTSQTQGSLTNTQNPTDLAIQGSGLFRIAQANGDLAFTRAGNFRISSDGHLVTQNGESLDPAIQVPPQATGITIGPDGTVNATMAGKPDPTRLGTIELAVFTNPAGLNRIGNNLMVETPASGPAQMVKPGDQGSGSLAQGSLEGSNVQAVEEMIDLISTQRSYEMSSQVITTADQMLQRLTQMQR